MTAAIVPQCSTVELRGADRGVRSVVRGSAALAPWMRLSLFRESGRAGSPNSNATAFVHRKLSSPTCARENAEVIGFDAIEGDGPWALATGCRLMRTATSQEEVPTTISPEHDDSYEVRIEWRCGEPASISTFLPFSSGSLILQQSGSTGWPFGGQDAWNSPRFIQRSSSTIKPPLRHEAPMNATRTDATEIPADNAPARTDGMRRDK